MTAGGEGVGRDHFPSIGKHINNLGLPALEFRLRFLGRFLLGAGFPASRTLTRTFASPRRICRGFARLSRVDCLLELIEVLLAG